MNFPIAALMPHRISRLTPGGSRILGSPRNSGRASDLALEFGFDYKVVRAEEPINWQSLKYDDDLQIDFQLDVPESLPEIGLLHARNARVLGSDGWPVVGRDHLIRDSHFIHEDPEFRSYERFTYLPKRQKLEGTTLNLGAAFSSNNYGHALLDGLGKLAVADKAQVVPERVDHVLLPSFVTKAMEGILLRAGYPREKWIVLARGGHLYCEELLNPCFPGAPRVYSPIVPNYYRQFTDDLGQSGRRLFISRVSGRRLISNIDELMPILDHFGFESYDPVKAKSSPADFAAAEIIVGAHGAGLADLAFCRPATKVIEFLPSGHRYPYFASLAIAASLDYLAIRGRSADRNSHADFSIDPANFRAVIERSLDQVS